MSDNFFDETIAATYDVDESRMFEPATLDATVDFLVELAHGGPALEFAIGTGRIALALSSRGVSVSGIELSEAMIARLRSKPGGDETSIPIAIGDMTTVHLDDAGAFTVVLLAFNTITNLLTQEQQVACFVNAARHLAPGGCFVVETFVPALRRLPQGQRLVPFDVSATHIGIDEYNVATQTLVSHHTNFRGDVTTHSAQPFRYVWPAELDLMANIAGLHLRERWADWRRTPFDNDSESHVSVWENQS